MIRVNLLAGDRVPRQQRAAGGARWPLALGCGALLVAVVAGSGWRAWSLHERSTRLDRELAAAQATLRRLAPAAEDLAALEARRAELDRREALVEELRRARSGPVRLLDAIGRSVPDGLWLSSLGQSPEGVVIEGHAVSLHALSDFVANLERSGQVTSGVEIIDSHAADAAAGGTVRFALRARFGAPAREEERGS